VADLAEEGGETLDVFVGLFGFDGVDDLLQSLPAVVVFVFELVGGHGIADCGFWMVE
jgi:hypothetical protein